MALKNIYNITSNGLADVANYLSYLKDQSIYRPIGLLYKSYRTMRANLSNKIGQENIQDFLDGESGIIDYSSAQAAKLGPTIAYPAIIGDDISYPSPWFYTDEYKKEFADYRDYLRAVYPYQTLSSFITSHKSTSSVDIYEGTDFTLEDNMKVGVVHSFDMEAQQDPWGNTNTSEINPNLLKTDTRIGAVGGFLLKKTLENSIRYGKNIHEYSYYNEPSVAQNTDNQNKKGGYSITQGAYSNFGIDGIFGIKDGEFNRRDVRWTSEDLIGDIIPWSTVDHVYNTSVVGGGGEGNISMVQSLLGLETSEDLNVNFLDLAQKTQRSNLYYPFGNYYSITYSLGLIGTSGSKTVEFITRSMLGYDLLADNAPTTLDYLEDTIKARPKKYYASLGSRGTTYIDVMTAMNVDYVKYTINGTEQIVRLNLIDSGNDNSWARQSLLVYAEAEANKKDSPYTEKSSLSVWNKGVSWGIYKSYNTSELTRKKDIIQYTNNRFINKDYDTIIARFHTDEFPNGKKGARANRDFTSSAVSQYGMSHGRNLLKANHNGSKTNGYSNPYCRVWTFHHQYSTIQDLIRPFDTQTFEGTYVANHRRVGGQSRLEENTVLNHKNGYVNITPTSDWKEGEKLKNVMFSIENLAWKDSTDDLNKSQIGPLGGRIMWFPPYNLSWNESVGVNWNETQFIGRGEKIPTYTDTDRKGSLTFDILIDHPSCVNDFSGGVSGGDSIGDVDDVNSNEQTLLRFFAGCDILNGVKKTNSTKKKENTQPPKNPIIPSAKNDKKIVFFVYFPNNYTGVDDLNTSINPIYYLLNGFGTQHTKNEVIDPSDWKKKIGYGYEMSVTNEGLDGDQTQVNINSQNYSIWVNSDDNSPLKYKPNKKCSQLWGYRVDKRTCNEKLIANKQIDNYLDYTSYRFNSIGYERGAEGRIDKGEDLYSFSSVFLALTDRQLDKENIKEKLVDNYPIIESQVNKINKLLDDFGQISQIIVTGYASKDGYTASNKRLAQDRAKTIAAWLKKHPKIKNAELVHRASASITGTSNKGTDINREEAKKWRSCKVELVLTTQEVEGISNINKYDNDQERNIEEGRQSVENAYEKGGLQAIQDIINEPNKNSVRDLSIATVLEDIMRLNDAQAKENAAWQKTTTPPTRYGDEYKYFKDLEKTDPFLHSKLVEKFKYFDPAYHSITPEGFVERLTFLHQCTRQGPTISASDNNNFTTAANLAFGRPPILVLRLGDFYYTRFIITSMQIDFKSSGGVRWDLNQEGIGVMPMYASITLQIVFLGGSELGGPIRRLQNATSFNYYANASVFDNRAETVEYANGLETKFNSHMLGINENALEENKSNEPMLGGELEGGGNGLLSRDGEEYAKALNEQNQ